MRAGGDETLAKSVLFNWVLSKIRRARGRSGDAGDVGNVASIDECSGMDRIQPIYTSVLRSFSNHWIDRRKDCWDRYNGPDREVGSNFHIAIFLWFSVESLSPKYVEIRARSSVGR